MTEGKEVASWNSLLNVYLQIQEIKILSPFQLISGKAGSACHSVNQNFWIN